MKRLYKRLIAVTISWFIAVLLMLVAGRLWSPRAMDLTFKMHEDMAQLADCEVYWQQWYSYRMFLEQDYNCTDVFPDRVERLSLTTGYNRLYAGYTVRDVRLIDLVALYGEPTHWHHEHRLFACWQDEQLTAYGVWRARDVKLLSTVRYVVRFEPSDFYVCQ